jgi:BNR repeat-containing family member
VVVAMVLGSCLPEGAEQVPYRMDASNQAGWWSPIEERNGSVYVAYNAWGSSAGNHTVYVARRDPSGAWTRGCLRVGGGCAVYVDDIGHNQPSLSVDGDGYIHVFASMHHNNWRYFRSASPGDPTNMVDRSAEMPDQGGQYTYPNTTSAPNGDVYVIIRAYPNGGFYRWDNATDTWSRVATFAAHPNYVVYPDDVESDASGNLHLAWEWAHGGPNGLRHLGSYMRYEPATGQFFDAAGAPLAVPVGIDSTAVYQPLEPGESSTSVGGPTNPAGFQSAKLTVDPATGYPIAAFRLRPTDGGNFQVRLAQWDGTAWQRQVVYAGRYTTYAAIDVTLHQGRPRVYYAKTAVPNGDQAFVSVRQPDGRWVEDPPLLPGIPIERLAVDQSGARTTDHVYLSAPTQEKLYVRHLQLPAS